MYKVTPGPNTHLKGSNYSIISKPLVWKMCVIRLFKSR